LVANQTLFALESIVGFFPSLWQDIFLTFENAGKNVSLEKDFIARVNRFLDDSGMAASRLGRIALNDSAFVLKVLDGRRSPSMRTVQQVDGFMEQWRRDHLTDAKGKADDGKKAAGAKAARDDGHRRDRRGAAQPAHGKADRARRGKAKRRR
jgi:hypothetical protein